MPERASSAVRDRRETPAAEEGLLRAEDVMRLLAVSRSTLYTIPFFRERAIRVGRRGVRWERRDLELYKALHAVSQKPRPRTPPTGTPALPGSPASRSPATRRSA